MHGRWHSTVQRRHDVDLVSLHRLAGLIFAPLANARSFIGLLVLERNCFLFQHGSTTFRGAPNTSTYARMLFADGRIPRPEEWKPSHHYNSTYWLSQIA